LQPDEERGVDPDINYFRKCVEEKIVAQPAFAKVEDKSFHLNDFWINEGMATALA